MAIVNRGPDGVVVKPRAVPNAPRAVPTVVRKPGGGTVGSYSKAQMQAAAAAKAAAEQAAYRDYMARQQATPTYAANQAMATNMANYSAPGGGGGGGVSAPAPAPSVFEAAAAANPPAPVTEAPSVATAAGAGTGNVAGEAFGTTGQGQGTFGQELRRRQARGPITGLSMTPEMLRRAAAQRIG